MATKSFHDYMRAYGEDHQHPVNKLCHMVGIPVIVASLPLLPTVPPLGATMFGAGWALQFAGHFVEGKKPSFTSDLRYLAIGPVWCALEWAELLTGKRLYSPPPASPAPAAGGAASAA